MTTREELHHIIDDLSESDLEAVYEFMRSRHFDEPVVNELPEFFGMLDSEETDLAARSSEILRAEFGRS